MYSSEARVVRGLSIANIVISILVLLLALVAIGFSFIIAAAFTDPTISAEATSSLSSSDLATLSAMGLTADDASTITVGLFFVYGGCLFVGALLNLIAGIIDLRSCKNGKYGGAFVWAIVGAITSFLCGSFICTVLFIIAAVYLSKLKKAPLPTNPSAPYSQPLQ